MSEESPSSPASYKMSSTTSQRPQHISFQQTPSSSSGSLRQGTLKKNMSITQTYYLAHKARSKLSREAAQPDHDLRLLVGHANLLDNLMLELADAEREQERWFNQSVRGAHTAQKKQDERRVQWAENIVEAQDEDEDEEDDYDSDSSDDDYEEEDDIVMTSALRPVSKSSVNVRTQEVRSEDDDDEVMEDDLEEDYAQLELVRTPSHSNSPPPELVDESDSSEDEDASMPPSPPEAMLSIDDDEKQASRTKSEQEGEESLYDGDYYLPTRRNAPIGSVSSISVY